MAVFHGSSKKLSGKQKTSNYEILIERMLLAFQDPGCNMSVKIHFLYSHLYQDLQMIKDCYQGRWKKDMVTE